MKIVPNIFKALLALYMTIGMSPIALSQFQTAKQADRQLDPLDSYKETIQLNSTSAEAIKYISEILKAQNISKSLKKMSTESQNSIEEKYGRLFPELEFGKEAKKTALVDSFRKELTKASTKKFFKSLSIIKEIQKLNFSFNFFGAKKVHNKKITKIIHAPEQQVATNNPITRSSRNQKRATTPSEKPQFVAVTAASEQDETDDNLRSYGQFKAGLSPNLDDKEFSEDKADKAKTGFNFTLSQGGDLYKLNLPIYKNTTHKELSHVYRLPLSNGFKAGQNLTYKGIVAKTSVLYKLSDDKNTPEVGVHYRHLKHEYVTDCTFSGADDAKWTIESATPAKMKIAKEDLAGKKANYKVGYVLSF